MAGMLDSRAPGNRSLRVAAVDGVALVPTSSRSTASRRAPAMRQDTPLRNQLFGHRKTAARSGVFATSSERSAVQCRPVRRAATRSRSEAPTSRARRRCTRPGRRRRIPLLSAVRYARDDSASSSSRADASAATPAVRLAAGREGLSGDDGEQKNTRSDVHAIDAALPQCFVEGSM